MHLCSASHQMIVLACLALLLCAFTSGALSHDDKHTMCCTNYTSKLPRKVQITKCDILAATDDCVAAIAFTDQSENMYCFRPTAIHIRAKIEKKIGKMCEA